MRSAPRLNRARRHRSGNPAARLGPLLHSAVPALDPLMVGAIILLAALGILNLAAIGDRSLAVHQGLADILGLGVMVWAWRTPSRYWPWLGRVAYGAALVLLLAVALHGTDAYGAKRWLEIGSLVLQPSELAELGLVLVLAEVMSHRELGEMRRVGISLALAVPPIGLTLLEPDLSTSALLGVILVASLVLGRVRVRVMLGLVLAGLVLLPAGLRLLRPYQLARLHSFLDGGASTLGGSWTVLQSHIAIASGGLLGIGHSTVGRLLSTYLPARETDLAFASLVEQFGLVAGAIALLAVVILIWRLAAAATSSRTLHGSLIAGVMATLVGAEVALSVGGNLGVLPLAGVPIPLLGYGGTVSVAHLAAFGVILGSRLDADRRRLWRLTPIRVPRLRLARTVTAALAVSLVVLGGLTWQLQHLHGAILRQAALTEVTRWIPLPPQRGPIEDRQGQVLAADPASVQVLGIPGLVSSSNLPRLAGLLGETVSALRRQLAQPTHGTYTVTLASQLSTVRGVELQSASIPGVLVEPAPGRRYPYGSTLGPILGYTGPETPQQVRTLGLLPAGDTIGQAGLELEYQQQLGGHYGSQAILVNAQGVPVALGPTIPPRNGGTLVTSLDLNLQMLATKLLQKAIAGGYPNSQPGDQGAAVVLDPQNGQVLAMASWPAYNNNIFGAPRNSAAIAALLSALGSPLLEHATQTALPPGSNFKLVVSSADAAYGAIPTGEVIPTGYYFTYDGHTFHNWETLPPQDLPQAIAWSNDVYFYKLAVALGPQRMIAVAHQMGAGRLTGVDLPGEIPGYLGTPQSVAKQGETWYPGSTVILGIGQGYVTATPLQDALWTAEVGTGAKLVPRLGLLDSQTAGQPLQAIPVPAPQPLSFAGRLGPVRAGLRLAVTQGTADMLSGLHIDAGGKTGTAQDPGAPNGGPDAWFTALAPMSNPQVVVDMVVRGGGQGFYDCQIPVKDILRYFFANQPQILASVPPSAAPATSPTHAAPALPTAHSIVTPARHVAASAPPLGPSTGLLATTGSGVVPAASPRAAAGTPPGARPGPSDGAPVRARIHSPP
ncbi:MAG: FtsW/RodA/SpoVE family cell cycle protein [Candidatus Dormibacteria bacterium]